VAVAGLVVSDVECLGGWLAEIFRVLRANGRLVYSDFHEDWAARAWQRTFTSGEGRRYALPYVARTRARHRAALAAAGFADVHVTDIDLSGDPVGVHRRPGHDAVCSIFLARKPSPFESVPVGCGSAGSAT
jgi:hypothetical protein